MKQEKKKLEKYEYKTKQSKKNFICSINYLLARRTARQGTHRVCHPPRRALAHGFRLHRGVQRGKGAAVRGGTEEGGGASMEGTSPPSAGCNTSPTEHPGTISSPTNQRPRASTSGESGGRRWIGTRQMLQNIMWGAYLNQYI